MRYNEQFPHTEIKSISSQGICGSAWAVLFSSALPYRFTFGKDWWEDWKRFSVQPCNLKLIKG
ncbi:MAG: hypothetical protein IJD28_04100 [Deferribacterales bacterium]|nr:hypothetical protein [Deferribacterales bacterium]